MSVIILPWWQIKSLHLLYHWTSVWRPPKLSPRSTHGPQPYFEQPSFHVKKKEKKRHIYMYFFFAFYEWNMLVLDKAQTFVTSQRNSQSSLITSRLKVKESGRSRPNSTVGSWHSSTVQRLHSSLRNLNKHTRTHTRHRETGSKAFTNQVSSGGFAVAMVTDMQLSRRSVPNVTWIHRQQRRKRRRWRSGGIKLL